MSGIICVRKSLCCFNLIFWVLGCGLLGVGIWLSIAHQNYSKILNSGHVLSGDSLIIFAGVMTFLLGFLGCCGSWFKNKCFLMMYSIFVGIVLLLEFIAGTLGFVYRKSITNVLQEELLSGIRTRYTPGNENGLKNAWDHIQAHFRCCGVDSFKDWYKISAWPEKDWVPSSCCLAKYSNMTDCGEMADDSYFYSVGCYSSIHRWIMEKCYILAIFSVVVAFIQLFGIICSLIIICKRTNKRK